MEPAKKKPEEEKPVLLDAIVNGINVGTNIVETIVDIAGAAATHL